MVEIDGEITKIEEWDKTHNMITVEGSFCKVEYLMEKGDYKVGDYFKVQLEGSGELMR